MTCGSLFLSEIIEKKLQPKTLTWADDNDDADNDDDGMEDPYVSPPLRGETKIVLKFHNGNQKKKINYKIN